MHLATVHIYATVSPCSMPFVLAPVQRSLVLLRGFRQTDPSTPSAKPPNMHEHVKTAGAELQQVISQNMQQHLLCERLDETQVVKETREGHRLNRPKAHPASNGTCCQHTERHHRPRASSALIAALQGKTSQLSKVDIPPFRETMKSPCHVAGKGGLLRLLRLALHAILYYIIPASSCMLMSQGLLKETAILSAAGNDT